MHFHFNFDAYPVHSPSRFMHLTHQNLSALALFCHNRPFQMRAWSCITSYPLRSLPYLAYDNVNPAVVISMMLRSFMPAFEKVYSLAEVNAQLLIYK